MKKYTTIKKMPFLFLLLTFYVAQSCSDFLEQEPGTQISINEQLSSKKGMLQALNGLYSALESNVRDERFATYADLQGGNLKFAPIASTNSSRAGQITIPTNLTNVYAFNDQAEKSNFEFFYSKSYEIINQSNLIIEFIDALPDATEVEKNQIKAEALTIRAYTHYLLSLLYSQPYNYTDNASHLGIVYNIKSLNKGIQYAARETLNNTYSFIIKDITTALQLYQNSFLGTGPGYSYFNSVNTKALLARVYLSKNDWQNAYDTSNDVILNAPVSLTSTANYISDWEKADLPISEILLQFSIPRDVEGISGGSLAAFFGYTSPTVYNRYIASKDLIDLYENTDLRKSLFLEIPLKTLVEGKQIPINYFFTKKFQGNAGYVAFRLSEQYLIRAEAALKLNRLDQAKADINTIRARANTSLLTDNKDLEEAVFLERRKELCFEGHLFFDLARNKKNIVRKDGCISFSCDLNYPSPKYVLPIPSSSININSNLKQNESY